MMTSLVLAVLTVPAAEPAKEPPAKLELFAAEDWYKGQNGKEADFVGVLMFKERPKDVVGFGRFNPYTLVMTDGAKTTVREVYVGGKPELLKPYIGKRVKLTGKAVDMEVEGKDHREIWPARLEVVPAEKKEEKSPERARQEAILKELDRLIREAEEKQKREREKQQRENQEEEVLACKVSLIQRLNRIVSDLEEQNQNLESRNLELRRELLKKSEQFYRDAAEKKPEPKEPPAKADILANHKLYKMEPGAEKEYLGVIQKEEKGGYTLMTQAGKAFGKMSLHLYPDAGDPLAPYVGKKVKLFGKYQAGATGTRTFEFVLPGRLEVIEEKQKPEPRREPVTIDALQAITHLFPDSVQPPAGSKPGIDPEMLKRALEGKKE